MKSEPGPDPLDRTDPDRRRWVGPERGRFHDDASIRMRQFKTLRDAAAEKGENDVMIA
jgi:hypothetical protein